MICAEEAIKPYAEKILKHVVYKLIIADDKENEEIACRAYKIAELLGLHI
jgi:hypothetical protein